VLGDGGFHEIEGGRWCLRAGFVTMCASKTDSDLVVIGLKAENGPIYTIVKREMLPPGLVLVKMHQIVAKMAGFQGGKWRIRQIF